MVKNIIKLCVVFICTVAIAACKEEDSNIPAPVKSVKVMEMQSNDTALRRSISGVVATSDQANLSFSISGQVMEILVKSGEKVYKDQPLASIDKKDFMLNLNNAKAKLNSAKADVAEKNATLTRQKKLKQQDFVSQAAVDNAETQYQLALSQLEVAQSEYDIAKRDLDNTTLKAPFDGKIFERLIDPFAEVVVGETILRIQGNYGLEVEILMPETLIRDIKHGDEVSVSFPTLQDVTVRGEVLEIGAKVESGNAFPVSVKLQDKQYSQYDDSILPGMTAEVHFTLGNGQSQEQLFTIPVSAIDMRVAKDETNKLSKQQIRIFVYDPVSKTAQHRIVKARTMQNNDIVVYDGLEVGDIIITAGTPFLRNGQAVKPWTLDYKKPAKLDF